MSYILEALKKADADRERERSAVPSLHAHTDALGFERERRGGAALGASWRWAPRCCSRAAARRGGGRQRRRQTTSGRP
jgi:hypothetical protein